jgi:hypothetical protein
MYSKEVPVYTICAPAGHVLAGASLQFDHNLKIKIWHTTFIKTSKQGNTISCPYNKRHGKTWEPLLKIILPAVKP